MIAEVENLYTIGELDPERHPHLRHLRGRGGALQRRVLHAARGEVQWPSARSRPSPPAPAGSSRTGRSSTSASACRRSSPTTCPRASTSSSRPRTAPSASAPRRTPGCEDRDRANAGNQPITLIPGGSYFDSATSFAHDPRRPRGRHLPGHAPGRREGQHRQLDRARQDARRHGRRHGPHHRRQDRLHRQRALLQGRRLQAHEGVHLPAHRRRRGRRDHHRAGAVPPLPGQGLGARRGRRSATRWTTSPPAPTWPTRSPTT